MDKKTALQILQSRVLVAEPGKYTVKCTSTNLFTDESGTRTIVNFNVMTPYQAELATKAFKEGNYEGATGKGTSLSTSQLQGQFVPQKGEVVDIEVSNHVNKEGITILVVSSIVPRKAIQAKAFSLAEEEVEEPAEEQIV